jgi:hypothetical protein
LSISGEAVRLFGKVIRPNSSIIECFQSSFPSAENAAKTPELFWM